MTPETNPQYDAHRPDAILLYDLARFLKAVPHPDSIRDHSAILWVTAPPDKLPRPLDSKPCADATIGAIVYLLEQLSRHNDPGHVIGVLADVLRDTMRYGKPDDSQLERARRRFFEELGKELGDAAS